MADFNRDAPQAYFDALFSHTDDPWGFRIRWYEERKRALTLASLPAQRYASAFEPGCANGELSLALATRCDQLLVSDGTARAVDAARIRLAPLRHVKVQQAWLPDEWPAGQFDLVVVSELAYYFDAQALENFITKLRAALRPGGTVLACHWRRPIKGCAFTGDEVHQRLQAGLRLQHVSNTTDADLRLDVWRADTRSVAEREGLV